jgi:transcriptional regulator with XRE-family HTH domain
MQKKRELELKRYGQEAFAHDARLHRTEIGKIERAETEPRLLTLMILAHGLGVTLNDLVEGLPVPQERKPPPGTPEDQ